MYESIGLIAIIVILAVWYSRYKKNYKLVEKYLCTIEQVLNSVHAASEAYDIGWQDINHLNQHIPTVEMGLAHAKLNGERSRLFGWDFEIAMRYNPTRANDLERRMFDLRDALQTKLTIISKYKEDHRN